MRSLRSRMAAIYRVLGSDDDLAWKRGLAIIGSLWRDEDEPRNGALLIDAIYEARAHGRPVRARDIVCVTNCRTRGVMKLLFPAVETALTDDSIGWRARLAPGGQS